MTALQDLQRRTAPALARTVTVGARAWRIARPALIQVRPVSSSVSRLGWSVLATGVGSWLLGWYFGWIELMLLAATALILLVLCGLLTIGRSILGIEVDVEPRRVVVGTLAAGQVRVKNRSRRVLLPVRVELPIGATSARFHLPMLRGGDEHEELFVVPTRHRGVIPIGPALTVRGDPLGLMRRTMSWTDVIELFVYPITVPLDPLSTGLLRDLEGQTTNDVSMSDLAFHALREYQPGDDRRYIHWRSSAKAGRFLVRQFLDTRRSHITAVVDSDAASYADAADYELAISAAASVAVRAIQDEQEVTVLAGGHAVPSSRGQRVLDTFARAQLGIHGLTDLAARAVRIAPDTSIVLMVTGSEVTFLDLQRAAAHFPPEVRTVALRIDPSAATGITGAAAPLVLTLRALSELPLLLQGALQ
jgi:uncharacterized protein (DUF58 family)